MSFITFLNERTVERNGAKQWNMKRIGELLASATSKNVAFFSAMRANILGHIFHDSQNGNSDLLEHLQAALGNLHGKSLRGHDDHSATQAHSLRKCQLNISGSWWQIQKQIIQLSPVHFR